MEKVKIELRPYDALQILTFLREFINEENKNLKEFAAIHESVNAYESQVYDNCTEEMVRGAELELSVNTLTQRVPKK